MIGGAVGAVVGSVRRLASLPRRAAVRAELCDIWAEVLERPVAPGEGFFDLGGSSLHAVMISGRAEERFGIPVPVRLVLQSGSVAEMADEIVALRDGSSAGARRTGRR